MRKEFESYCQEGAHKSIVINKADYLTPEQTLEVLKAIRGVVERGDGLEAIDSTEIGDKFLHCNWGMCSNSVEVYNKPEMHTFPQDFEDYERCSPLSPYDVPCPMNSAPNEASGCFHSCRVFKNTLKTPSKEETLELYGSSIATLQENLK